ncbi:histidine kinase [Klebsiella variicola]|nr:histidine kinase [Klebsiella variicola]
MIGIRGMIEAQVLGLTGMALKRSILNSLKGSRGFLVRSRPSGRYTAILPRCSAAASARLLLQMLHPLALAGVWDHSRFREDIFGRLRRTSQFISATTFATTPTPSGSSPKCRGSISGSAGWIRTERLIRPAIRRC